MVQIIAKRGSMTLTYKTSFDGDSYKLDFLSVNGGKNISRKSDAVEKSCGIDKDVKNLMVKTFFPLMPNNRHPFWQNLANNK